MDSLEIVQGHADACIVARTLERVFAFLCMGAGAALAAGVWQAFPGVIPYISYAFVPWHRCDNFQIHFGRWLDEANRELEPYGVSVFARVVTRLNQDRTVSAEEKCDPCPPSNRPILVFAFSGGASATRLTEESAGEAKGFSFPACWGKRI